MECLDKANGVSAIRGERGLAEVTGAPRHKSEKALVGFGVGYKLTGNSLGPW